VVHRVAEQVGSLRIPAGHGNQPELELDPRSQGRRWLLGESASEKADGAVGVTAGVRAVHGALEDVDDPRIVTRLRREQVHRDPVDGHVVGGEQLGRAEMRVRAGARREPRGDR
jgi:hypothetical protein